MNSKKQIIINDLFVFAVGLFNDNSLGVVQLLHLERQFLIWNCIKVVRPFLGTLKGTLSDGGNEENEFI